MTSTHLEFALAESIATLPSHLLRAVADIQSIYDDRVSIVKKSKTLRRFGWASSIDNAGYADIWGGHVLEDGDVYRPAGNAIDTISSSNAGDTQDVVIEGHTIASGVLTFVTQTVTLSGQTEVDLGTALHTVVKAYNTGATDFAGNIYIYDDADGSTAGVPTDLSDVAVYIPAGESDSQVAATALSNDDYFIITDVGATVNKQQSASVDVRHFVKEQGGVWRPSHARIAVATNGLNSVWHPLDPCIIVPKNAYTKFQAISSSASDTEVSAFMGGYLAVVDE